jgi:hypothetical protein
MMIPQRHRPKPRRFEYEPRFYDPTHDERLKQRIRIKSKASRGQRPSFLFLAILFLLSLLIYLQL